MKSLMMEFKKETVLLLIINGIMAALQVIPSVLLTFATNAILNNQLQKFILWDVFIVLIWVIYVLSDYYYSIFEEKNVQKISTELRVKIANKIGVISPEKYQEVTTGAYISNLTNDINMIESGGLKSLYQLFNNIWLVLFSATALLIFSPWLLLASLALSFLLLILPYKFQSQLAKIGQKLSDQNEEFTNRITDILGGYKVLLYARRLGIISKKTEEASRHLGDIKVDTTRKKTIINNTIAFFSLICQVLVDLVTGLLIIFGKTTFGAISSAGNLAANIFNSVSLIGNLISETLSVTPMIEKIYREVPKENLEEVEEFKSKISIENLSFGYTKETKVLNHLNLNFEKGKKYALVGKSGSGKSTILRILAGEIKNYSGLVKIDEKDINGMELFPILQYIDQSVYLFEETLRNNISLWKNYTTPQIELAMEKANVDFVTNLDVKVQENGANLSGGQKQRVALARSFIEDKKIILLDEGTSALDRESAIMIENILLDDPNLTVIMVSHNLHDENRDKIDQVIDLDNLS